MSRKTASVRKQAIFVYIAYVLRYLSVLILVPYYGRVLGPSNYGTVLAAMSLMMIVWMVVSFGYSPAGSRSLAVTDDAEEHGAIFSRQLCARLILAPVGLLLGLAGTWASSDLREHFWFGVLATLLGISTGMNLGWFFQGLRKFKLSLIFEAASYPLNVAFVLLFVRNSEAGANALGSLLASSLITTAGAYLTALRIVRPVRVTLEQALVEIKGSITFFVQGVNSLMMTSGSTYLLSVLSTSEQVGFFGSVEKLTGFGLAFLGPAAQVLIPTITHRTHNSPFGAIPLIRKGIFFEISFGLLSCIAGALTASVLIPLVFGYKFTPAIIIFQIMVLALPFASLTHAIGSYVMVPIRHERLVLVAYALGNLCNFAAIAFFIEDVDSYHVAIARVIGESVTAVVITRFAIKKMPGLFFPSHAANGRTPLG